jgi:hypothetical protein
LFTSSQHSLQLLRGLLARALPPNRSDVNALWCRRNSLKKLWRCGSSKKSLLSCPGINDHSLYLSPRAFSSSTDGRFAHNAQRQDFFQAQRSLAMSIKRTKQRSAGSRHDDLSPFSLNKKPEPEEEKTWEEYMANQPLEAFVPYSLNAAFTKGQLIAHAKFGNGIVLAVEGARIDSLFSEGKKRLTHKPK